ncbi:MAG: hypothetical protein ACOC41_08395 [Chitinivibrionales bacterium]
MITQECISRLLDTIPKDKWVQLSNIVSSLTAPTIGSPIMFRYRGFTIQEFKRNDLRGDALEKFIAFTYPKNMPGRKQEIELDRQYWPFTSTFLVSDYDGKVVGCIQSVTKETENKLPVEFGRQVDETGHGRKISFPVGSTEIYRCKRSDDLKGTEALAVVMMLFKAIYAKVLQEGTKNSFISFNPGNQMLRNMYIRKLAFEDSRINLLYGDSDMRWGLLTKDWIEHAHKLATLSKSHFSIQTFSLSGLKKEYLQPASQMCTTDQTGQRVLFAQVQRAAHTRLRASVSKNQTNTYENV